MISKSPFKIKICYFIKSLLVKSIHKAQFKRYISTDYIDKKRAVELYDNLLINLQRWINLRIGIILCIVLYIFFQNPIIWILICVLLSYILNIFTYYPCRMIINYIFPLEYHNGSHKNYATIKDQSLINNYVPERPLKKENIGSYSPWKCPNCKKRNFIANRICAKCDFEHYWQCSKCATLNISDNLSCINCNIEKNASKKLLETWTCKNCKEEHENIFDECWKCAIN